MTTSKKKKKLPAKSEKKERHYRRLLIEDLVPNDWSANVLSDDGKVALLNGMLHDLAAMGRLSDPVKVRPHPSISGKFQIVDGFHRWSLLRAEGKKRIDCFVYYKMDDKTAMLRTDSLNTIGGNPDPEKQAQYFHRLQEEHHMPLEEIAENLPYIPDEIQSYLDAHEIEVINIEIETEEGETTDPLNSDSFVDIRFVVSASQAEVVEREIARISACLEGKNKRGRSLEFMAVQSSQTPLEEAEVVDEETPAPRKKKKKKPRG